MCWALTYIILQTCLNSSPVFDLLFFLLSVNSDINYDSYSQSVDNWGENDGF